MGVPTQEELLEEHVQMVVIGLKSVYSHLFSAALLADSINNRKAYDILNTVQTDIEMMMSKKVGLISLRDDVKREAMKSSILKGELA